MSPAMPSSATAPAFGYKNQRRDSVLFTLLLFLLCLSPLRYGAVEPIAWSLLIAGISVLALIHAVLSFRAPIKEAGIASVPTVPMLLFAGVLVWILVQWIPWTPEAWHHPLWSIAAAGLENHIQGRISIDPEATVFSGLRLIAYALLFWLGFSYGRDARLARRAMRVVVFATGLYAGLNIVLWATSAEGFLWFDADFVARQTNTEARRAIPFINPNHFASFAGMALVIAIALLIEECRSLWTASTPINVKLRRFFSYALVENWWIFIAVILLATSGLHTLSRSGIAASLIGLMTLLGLLTASRVIRFRRLSIFLGLTVFFLALSGVAVAFWDRLTGAETDVEQRLLIYENSLEAIKASPWLGYGTGSFESVYRLYNDHDLTTIVVHAHSTVLELIIELGIPAALALMVVYLWLVLFCVRGCLRRRRHQCIPATAAALGVLFALNSLAEFPLQIPAITALFALFLGIGVSQSYSSRLAAGARARLAS